MLLLPALLSSHSHSAAPTHDIIITTQRDTRPKTAFATMDQVWADKIANSEALKDYAADRGALFTPHYGEDAHERAMGMVRQNAWLLYDAGKAPNDPSQFGIEKPAGM